MTNARLSLFGILLAGFSIIAAACSDTGTSSETVAAAEDPTVAPTTPGETPAPPTSRVPAVGALPDGPSALDHMTDAAFPEPLVDPQRVRSGGPPPDGIPSIDDPRFLPVIDHLDLLPADEPVVALEVDGDARAYPVRIMIWHEIVNDTVGGVPVSVTYCPLCNSAASYVREIDGVETTFGTSGRLYVSALVMYDRATESLWTHFDGRAVIGVLTGAELEILPSPLMSWDSFISAYPDGRVLDETQTGFSRRYGANPYVGYDNPDARPFLFAGDVDARQRAMQRVVGVEVADATLAVSLDVISGDDPSATPIRVGGSDLVVLWEPGQSTALQSDSIDGGRDVGTTGVFHPTTADGALTFTVADGTIRDEETGSTWTSAGIAIDGPLAGSALERVPHLDTFWFAWSTYQPDTELIAP
jgi:hypothetical protein